MISCLIVDDEQIARDGLVALCQTYPQLQVIGTCKNGIEAIDSIQSYKPDLVLLDIQMPKINGFEVLASLTAPLPKFIFITAHDEFAIKAFEVNAIDYLLKPFSDVRFDKAIKRAMEQSLDQSSSIASLKWKTRRAETHSDLRDSNEERLVIKLNGSIHMIPKEKIIYVEAYDYYIKIHHQDEVFVIRETMKNMEASLDPHDFMRVHKSYIVNKRFISSLVKSTGDYQLSLITNEQIKVSRTKLKELRNWIV